MSALSSIKLDQSKFDGLFKWPKFRTQTPLQPHLLMMFLSNDHRSDKISLNKGDSLSQIIDAVGEYFIPCPFIL